MAVVQQKLLDVLRDAAAGVIDHATVNVEGALKQYPIYKTVKDINEVTVYVYVDDVQAQGKILGAFLADAAGDSLMAHDMTIIKGDSGLLIAFKLKLKVEVTVA